MLPAIRACVASASSMRPHIILVITLIGCGPSLGDKEAAPPPTPLAEAADSMSQGTG